MDLAQFVLAHEPAIRLSFFGGTFAIVALWEWAAPRRALTVSKALRWSSNLGLVMLDAVLLRLMFPLAAVGVAAFGGVNGRGVLNHFQVPLWPALPAAVVAMDLVIWLQHVMVHTVPALRRLHRVHHAELDDDLTTGLRFHPIETQPRAGHAAIVIGIREHAELREVARLDGMLLMPFRRQVDGYTINRRRWPGERAS